MNYIRRRVLGGELMVGVGCVLGSSLTAEMAGRAGFDWLWLDLEHGSGDYMALLHQVQAISGTAAAPVVRVRWNEPPLFKRVLDLGVAGVVVPWVNTRAEAEQAARAMRFPPEGVRGVARLNRATGFGEQFDAYFASANENLLTVVQIETAEAVRNAPEIAAVPGVDVLFVGPLDLSVSLGAPNQTEHPQFREALDRVLGACRAQGKAAGIMVPREDMMEQLVEQGFTFLVAGSDGGFVAAGLRRLRTRVDGLKRK